MFKEMQLMEKVAKTYNTEWVWFSVENGVVVAETEEEWMSSAKGRPHDTTAEEDILV